MNSADRSVREPCWPGRDRTVRPNDYVGELVTQQQVRAMLGCEQPGMLVIGCNPFDVTSSQLNEYVSPIVDSLYIVVLFIIK